MVVSEAMASALPVIVSREAGASELVTHGVDGYLLEACGDAAEVARYLDLLGNSAERRARLGAAARNRVASLSWDEIARQTLDVYRHVAAAGA